VTNLTSPTSLTSAYWAIDNSLALIERSARISLRNVEALLTAVILPVLLMLLFVYVFGGAINTGGAYVNYVVPGIVVLCAAFGSSMTATSVAYDMSNGSMDRFRSLPIVSGAVLTGHVVASVARNIVAMVLVLGVALLVGWRPNAGVVEWAGAIGVLLLFMAAISWTAAALGLLVKSVDAASGITFGVTFLPYLSSAFVPTDTMPAWLQPIAENNPITPMIETVRSLFMGAPVGDAWWQAVAWFGGILVVAWVAAALLFKRQT
jgi:ABC-2 type transport system permease protein